MMMKQSILAMVALMMIVMTTANAANASVYGDRVMSDAPIHYWSFDESASGTASATDLGTPGGETGIFGGTVTRIDGLVGLGATSFTNTAGDNVSVGASSYSYTTGFTIEAVIAPTWNGASLNYDQIFRKEDGGNRILFSFQNDANNGSADVPVAAGPVLSFGVNINGVYSELDMPLDGTDLRPSLADLTNGNPHYVAATYDANTGVKAIWVDGAMRWSTTLSGNLTTGGGVAARIGNTSSGTEPFTGAIDEVALYDTAHTINQVAARHLALTTRLISDLDIADTFTRQIYGGLDNRNLATDAPLTDYTPEIRPVGSSATWVGEFSIADDGNISNGVTIYPGSNQRGSDSGITQSGVGGDTQYAIEYGLRSNFVVQFDTLLSGDRVNIHINDASVIGNISGITDNVGLAVFFRSDDHAGPSIGVYNGVSEIDTGLTTGLSIGEVGQWHNFATQFNLDDGTLTFWVDQVNRGTFDYATVFGSLITSNAFVGIGSNMGDRLWVDNFQIGAPIPTPAALPAGLALLAGMLMRRRTY